MGNTMFEKNVDSFGFLFVSLHHPAISVLSRLLVLLGVQRLEVALFIQPKKCVRIVNLFTNCSHKSEIYGT